MSPADITGTLAAFVAEHPPEGIPADVRALALRTIADTVLTATAGAVEDATTVVTASLRPWMGTGSSRTVADVARGGVTPPYAALVNGVAAHALDFDAISFAVSGFVGSATIAALSALAEDPSVEASSDDVLVAYCLGWEAAAAIARGVNPLHYAMGWHPTATMSGFAAAAAAARLLRLDAERTAMALGIAVSEASGVKTMIGNMANPWHVGKAARNGVVAAQLAAGGFLAHPAALEAEQGFLNLFSGPDHYDGDRIARSVGSPWDLGDPGPVFKVHPCCGLIHSGLDAVIGLREAHDLAVADVRRVVVRVHEYVPTVMHVERPETGYQAKFSVPYCTAAALRDGAVTLRSFAGVDPELLALGERVSVEVHPELTGGDTFFREEFTEVEVVTRAGSVSARVKRMDNRGTGGISRALLHDKARDCYAYGGLDPDAGPVRVDEILATDGAEPWDLWRS